MKRNDHPAARPPRRSAGQATGSMPPESRASRPAHGKRNAKATMARAGLHAAASASPTAISRTGRRSGAAGGNPTANRSPDPPIDRRKRKTLTPVPGDRFIGSSVHRFICPETLLRVLELIIRCSDGPILFSSPVVLLQRCDPRPFFLTGADRLDGGGGGGEGRQAGNLEAQRRGPDRGFVVV